jgi:hypothetical protein
VVLGHVDERFRIIDARIVDENVDRRLGADRGGDGCGVGNVALERPRRAAVVADFAGHGLEVAHGAAHRDHLGAGLAEGQRAGAPEAAPGPRHHRDLAVEAHRRRGQSSFCGLAHMETSRNRAPWSGARP